MPLNQPDGQVGDCNIHVCTIFLPGSSVTYFPLTPPPNNEYSPPGSAFDFAGARVHTGIRFSSVRREKKSFASTMNVADVLTSLVLIALTFCAAEATETFFAAALIAAAGAGVLAPLAGAESWPATVRSRPWVSRRALGNALNLASRAAGNCFFASEYKASTAGDEPVDSAHSYWKTSYQF
jgi:hypothetical protein